MNELEILQRQAMDAINRGADPAKVNAFLKQMAMSKGLVDDKAIFNFQKEPTFENVKSDFNNVQSGSGATTFNNVEGGADTNYYAGDEDPLYPGLRNDVRNLRREAGGLLIKGLGGLGIAAGGALGIMYPGSGMDQDAFAAAEAARKAGDKLLVGNEGIGKDVGDVIGGIAPTSLAGLGPAFAQEDIAEGKDLPEAYKDLAKSTAINELGLAAGLPFKAAPGLLGVGQRAAVQAPANVALTAADKALSGEDITKKDLLLAAGLGVGGAFFKEAPSKPKVESGMPKTGDAVIDAGIDFVNDLHKGYDFDAAAKRQNDIITKRLEPEQGDMFTTSGESQVQGDMFGKPVDASLAESRRVADAEEGAPTRSPEQQAALEKSYFQQRQERLRAQREAADAATREEGLRAIEEQHAAGDNAEPTSPHPDFWDVGVPRNEQPVEATIEGTPDNPTGYTEQAPNDAMREAFREAGTRRAVGLQEENLYPDIRPENAPEQRPPVETVEPPQSDLFEPTKPKTLEQEQTQLPFPEQTDMFNKGNSPNSFKPYSRAEAPVVAKPRTLNDSIAEMKARREGIARAAPLREFKGSDGLTLFPKPESIPSSVHTALANNELTSGHILSSVIDNHGTLFTNAHEARGYAEVLKKAGDNLGGLNTKVEVFDPNNPVHADIKANNPTFEKGAAMYDPHHNIIILNKNVGMGTLVHEVGHAITEKAIRMGEEGQLKGRSNQAYQTLRSLFENIQPQLKERVQDNVLNATLSRGEQAGRAVNQNQAYGLTDLHEMMSELHANGAFRNFLKSIKLDDSFTKELPALGRMAIGKVKNTYDAVVKLVRNMLGLSPNADTALDAMFSASHDFLNSFDDTERAAIRKSNARNTKGAPPDLSFLGEQAPSRFGPSEQIDKAKALGKTLLKSKGIEPLAATARNVREGESALGDAEAAQAGNRLSTVVTAANREAIGKALAGDIGALKSLDDKTKSVVKAEMLANYDRSIEVAEQIAADPNKTAEQEAIASKILENAGAYQTRVYEADINQKYMARKLKAAAVAKQKQAIGQELTDSELQALKDVDGARKYLENQWLPTTDKLPSMSNERLDELYKFHTGLNPDEQFKGFDSKARKAAMAGAVADKLRALTNRDGYLDHIVKIAAGLGDKTNSKGQYFAGLRRSADVYSHLQHVPEELRAFWGEVVEPIARQVATVRAQYNYLSNLKSQNFLREEGLKSGLFSEKWSDKHSEVLSGDKMGPLQGMFMSSETKKAVDAVYTMNAAVGDLLDSALADRSGASLMVNAAAKTGKGVSTLAGVTKLADVLGNVGNLANNFIGSHLQLLSNGNINPIMYKRGAKMMLDSMLLERRSNMTQDAKDALRYKLVEYSHIQELQKNNAKSRMVDYIKAASEQPDPLKYLKTLLDTGKIGLEAYKEIYGSMDLWTKMANWHNELDFWTKHNEQHNTGLTSDQIKQAVADRINDTNITPSMAPQLLKGLERYGITRFATYYSEVARTSKNNAMIGLKDMADGVKNGQMDLFYHGLKRTLGTTASVAAQNKQIAALAAGVAGAMGLATEQMDEDDPRRKYMRKDDFLKNTDPLIVSDPSHPEAGQYAFDLSRPNPFGPVSIPVRNLIAAADKAARGDKAGALDKLKLAGENISGLWAPNTMWKALTNVVNAKAPGIKYGSPEFYNTAMEQLTSLGLTTKAANRLLSAIQPVEPKTLLNVLAAKEVPSEGLAVAVASGLGVSEFNVGKDIGSYLGSKAKADIGAAKDGYMSLLKQDFQSSPEAIEKAFVSSMKEAAEPYNKLLSAVEAAKAQGSTRSDLVKLLKASGISDEMSRNLLRGKQLQAKDIAGDLSKDLQGDLIQAIKDPAKRREAQRRFAYNEREIARLLRKYRNVPAKEL